jgi:hypothetical protein
MINNRLKIKQLGGFWEIFSSTYGIIKKACLLSILQSLQGV